jgi:hypothetical protein
MVIETFMEEMPSISSDEGTDKDFEAVELDDLFDGFE